MLCVLRCVSDGSLSFRPRTVHLLGHLGLKLTHMFPARLHHVLVSQMALHAGMCVERGL